MLVTEEDYDAALSEVDDLMDAKIGTDEGERLDALVTQIEAYEADNWVIDSPHPESKKTSN